VPLTDTRIRALKPGKAGRLIADGNGLYIRIRAARGAITRTWLVRRQEHGALTITTLGTYPILSLREARLKAAELAGRRVRHIPTVKEAADQWLVERINKTHRKADLVRGYVERAVLPLLGSRRISDIEPSELSRLVRDYRDRLANAPKARAGGLPAARALLGVIKRLFGYAVANGWMAQSPAGQLTAALIGAPPRARTRVLSDDEIRFVMDTTIRYGPVLRFLLLTGIRLGEAYNGYRDGQYWVVPANASKNKKEHSVWLSLLAVAQLDAFPWAAKRTSVQYWLTHNAEGWTAHDLRRTFSTRNNAMGVPPYIVERMLNHTFEGVMAVYNHASYDPERREALERWSSYLSGMTEREHGAAVVPFKPGTRAA
jgi:integrase